MEFKFLSKTEEEMRDHLLYIGVKENKLDEWIEYLENFENRKGYFTLICTVNSEGRVNHLNAVDLQALLGVKCE